MRRVLWGTWRARVVPGGRGGKVVGDGAVMEGGVVVVLRVRELRWRVPAPGFVDGRELRRVGGNAGAAAGSHRSGESIGRRMRRGECAGRVRRAGTGVDRGEDVDREDFAKTLRRQHALARPGLRARRERAEHR